MENRNLILSFDQAKRWYNGTDSELKELALKTYPELVEKELPKRWGELIQFNGYYVTQNCKIGNTPEATTRSESNKSSFTTKEQAEASIALAMYSQLLNAYKEVSFERFLDIAKEYEIKVRPILELFFFENAESAFYLGLLGQLMKVYNGDWVADFNDCKDKYTIYFYNGKIDKGNSTNSKRFLAFKDAKTRDLFLDNFRELILKARPLL